MKYWHLVICTALGSLILTGPALADPCEAPLPSHAGEEFSGLVRYVGDGDSLCVGQTDAPEEWIEVRLADFDAPELRKPGGAQAKAILVELALGKHIGCLATRGRSGRITSYDRVIGTCWIGPDQIGHLLRQREAPSGGR